MKNSLIFLILFSLSILEAHASIESEMNDFLNDIQGGSAFTSANVYEGQAYKYYTGGRAFVRVPQQNINPASIRMPHVSAGCGGIDAFAGGMSFISASELVNALKTTGGSAIAGYGFMLALRTVSSKLSNNLETVYGWADKINKFNANSCEMAQWAMNSTMSGEVLGLDQSNCIARRVSVMGESYTEAKNNCGSGAQSASTNNNTQTKQDSPFYGNLTWKIIKENNLFDNDVNTQMLAMNLIGTLVISNVKDVSGTEVIDDADSVSRKRIQNVPPQADLGDKIFNAMLVGGTIDLNVCTDTSSPEACQELTPQTITITPADSFVGKTTTYMANLYNHIGIKDTNALNPAEINFVKSTPVPVARIAAVANAVGGPAGDALLYSYIDRVARERLYAYIESIMTSVSAHVNQGKYGDHGDKFVDDLTQTRKNVAEIRNRDNRIGLANTQIIQELNHYEKVVVSRIPLNLNRSYLFAKGLK